jgi:hypothetical protein
MNPVNFMETSDEIIELEKKKSEDETISELERVGIDFGDAVFENLRLKDNIRTLNDRISSMSTTNEYNAVVENILTELRELRNIVRDIKNQNDGLSNENSILKLREVDNIKDLIINLLKNIPGFGYIAILLDRFGVITEISIFIVRYHIVHVIYNIFAALVILYYIELVIDSTLYCTIIYK